MGIGHNAGVRALVPMLHSLDPQHAALLADVGEGTVDVQGGAVVGPLNSRQGVGIEATVQLD